MNQVILKKLIAQVGTPCFVYDEKILEKNVRRIFINASKYGLDKRIKIYLAYFTNSNPILHALIKNPKVGILLQSPEEWFQIKKFKITKDITVSPGFLSDQEIDFWKSKNVTLNLVSSEEIYHVLRKYPHGTFSFRIDGTSQQNQRTGVKKRNIPDLIKFFGRIDKYPDSFSVYARTGSNLSQMKKSAQTTLDIYKRYLPQCKEINFGGGFAFDYLAHSPEKKHFSWDKYFAFLAKTMKKMNILDNVQLSFEPGRDIFADVGSILLRVNRIIEGKIPQIATDGSYVYIPSILKRERMHQVEYYGEASGRRLRQYMISGATTLSGDYILPRPILLPVKTKAGDLILVKDVGAYGATQHLEFLNKKPAPEVLIDIHKHCFLITKRGIETDKTRYVLKNPKRI